MATEVPIRCNVDIKLVVDIDITQKPQLRARILQIIQDLKTEYPDKIVDNDWGIDTVFRREAGKV